MISTGSGGTTGPRDALRYLAAVALFLAIVAVWYRYLELPGTGVFAGVGAFIDAKVYARALASWTAGQDPYTRTEALPFVYPPMFLRVVGPLASRLPAHTGWYGYLTLQAVCLLSVPWTLATAYLRSRWLTPAVAMLIFSLQPNLFEEYVLLTGNIANIFYPVALLAGVSGLRRNRWLAFYIVVVLAALIKPTFLALLLLPLLAGRGQWVPSALCVALVLAGYLSQRALMPQAYAAFQRNVYSEIVLRDDAGFNLFNFLHKQGRRIALLNKPAVLSALHLLVIGPLLTAFWLLRRRRFQPAVADLWVPALLVLIILANPRMQHIDAEVAVIPALYLCITCMRRATGAPSLGVVAVAFTVFEALTGKQLEIGMVFLFYTSLLLTLYVLAKSETAAGSEDAAGASLDPALEFS
jgi:hypothetical protein